MIKHLKRGLVIVIGALLALSSMAPTVLAQVDVDRALAKVLEEWKDGSTPPPAGVLERLAALGTDAAPAAPLLIAALRSSDATHRAQAARTLMNLGPAARPAIPALTELVRDPDPRVRQVAAWGLSNQAKMAEPSIPALVQALRGGPDRRGIEAVWPLVTIGEPAVPRSSNCSESRTLWFARRSSTGWPGCPGQPGWDGPRRSPGNSSRNSTCWRMTRISASGSR